MKTRLLSVGCLLIVPLVCPGGAGLGGAVDDTRAYVQSPSWESRLLGKKQVYSVTVKVKIKAAGAYRVVAGFKKGKGGKWVRNLALARCYADAVVQGDAGDVVTVTLEVPRPLQEDVRGLLGTLRRAVELYDPGEKVPYTVTGR